MTYSVGTTHEVPSVSMIPASVPAFGFPALPAQLEPDDDLPQLASLASRVYVAVRQLRSGFHAAIEGMIEEGFRQPATIDFNTWTTAAKIRWFDCYLRVEFFDEAWGNSVERYAALLADIANLLPRYRVISRRFSAIERMIGEYREDFECRLEEALATIADRAPRRMFFVIDSSKKEQP